MMSDPTPREAALEVLSRCNDLYSIIGAIVAVWGHFEQALIQTIQDIEGRAAMGAGVWPIEYSKIEKAKYLKGELARLIEAHGTTDDLRDLHKLYRRIRPVQVVRHCICHEITFMHEEQIPKAIEFYKAGRAAKGQNPRLVRHTYDDLLEMYCATYQVPSLLQWEVGQRVGLRLYDF